MSEQGLDPGVRTGVKAAVVDANGKLVATDTIYPHGPKNDWNSALATLTSLCMKHKVELVSIGNGTASRALAVVGVLCEGETRLSHSLRPQILFRVEVAVEAAMG